MTDYYGVLTQLHPQPNLGGDFSSNIGIIAEQLSPLDATINYLMTALNPVAYTYDSTGQFISDYVSSFVPTINIDTTTTSGLMELVVNSATEFASKGSVCMLPYGSDYTVASGYSLGINANILQWNVWKVPIGGWNFYCFENITPFCYCGYEAWTGTGPKQLYATPLYGSLVYPNTAWPCTSNGDGTHTQNKVFEYSSQWVVDVQPQQASSTRVSISIAAQQLINMFPPWVEIVFQPGYSDVPEILSSDDMYHTWLQTAGGPSIVSGQNTVFCGVSIITPSWLDTIYYNGGHQHDGSTGDGHTSKINFGTQITGTLEEPNISFTSNQGTSDFYLSSSEFVVDPGTPSLTVPVTYQVVGDVVTTYLPTYNWQSIKNTMTINPGTYPSQYLPEPGTCIPMTVLNQTNTNLYTMGCAYFDGTNFSISSIGDGSAQYQFNIFPDATAVLNYKGFINQTLLWTI